MIERLLVRRRESAAANWVYSAKLARLMNGTPQSSSADLLASRARRRLRFWDALLDVWTYRDRKSNDSGLNPHDWGHGTGNDSDTAP